MNISGSGAVVIVNKPFLGGACLILIHDYHNKWCDFGGALDQGIDSVANTIKEIYEESRCVIKLKEDSLTQFIDVVCPTNNTLYRAYLCELPDKKYCSEYNMADMSSMQEPCYHETKGMRYFPLTSVLRNIDSPTWESDCGGRPERVAVHPRINNVVKSMFKQGMFAKYISAGAALAAGATVAAGAALATSSTVLARAGAGAGAGIPMKKCAYGTCTKPCMNGTNYCNPVHERVSVGCLICKGKCMSCLDNTGKLVLLAFCSTMCMNKAAPYPL
jgi:hypothetical protein